jgi:hypothetical protein
MRTDPNASTSKAPRATAASRATPSGSVPDKDTKRTFELWRFCNTNSKIAANTTRTGSTRVHVLLARVDGILPGAVPDDAVPTAVSSLPVESSDTATGAATSSAVRDRNSRVPIGTPNLPPCDRGAIARTELGFRLSRFLAASCNGSMKTSHGAIHLPHPHPRAPPRRVRCCRPTSRRGFEVPASGGSDRNEAVTWVGSESLTPRSRGPVGGWIAFGPPTNSWRTTWR